jgi:hypothetical protein
MFKLPPRILKCEVIAIRINQKQEKYKQTSLAHLK